MTGTEPAALLALLVQAVAGHAADGLVVRKRPHGAAETMNRLEATVKERGLNVFARIDHAAAAMKVGKALRPTEWLIFGHAPGAHP